MPKVDSIQTNFTAGEISPKARGRFDIARYQNGAEEMTNVIVDVYGGAGRTPGTAFVVPAKLPATRARLVPFVFSRDAAYHLEFGAGYMRVIRAGAGQILSGGVAYEIATPYDALAVREFTYAQAADTMFIAHGDYPLHTLRRMGETDWLLAPAPLTVVPFSEVGRTMTSALSLSLPSVGNGRTLTTSPAAFKNSDVGRRVSYQSGSAIIRSYISDSQVTADIVGAFPAASIPSGWLLEDSPQAGLKPSAKGTVGQSITLTFDGTSEGWRLDEAGMYVRINRGLVLITSVGSTAVATGTVKQDLDSDVLAPASSWTLESSTWNAQLGYPRAVALSEQRLLAGGTTKYPQGIWGSRTGLYYDFTPGDNDTDGFFFNVYSEQVNLIEHLATMQAVVALTYGGEFTVQGGVEKPLAPTNVQIKSQSVYGCNPVRPVRIGNELLFVQRSGRKLRAMAYRVESDSYGAPDLSVLAEHLTASGISSMAYQQEPQPILWCVRNDGRLATLTIDRDEGVTGWTSQNTDGQFEDVSVAPAGDRDEVLVVVRREVGGETVRYIERFTAGYCVHSGIEGADEDGSAVWGGLDHLEGLTVDVVADGAPMDQMVVTGGEITLPRDANRVQIGLPYIPRIKLLPLEVGTSAGTAQASQTRVHQVNVLLLDTRGAFINDKELQFRRFGPEILDTVPAPYRGWEGVGESGWSTAETQITLEQRQPLPFHVLAVVRRWTVNNG